MRARRAPPYRTSRANATPRRTSARRRSIRIAVAESRESPCCSSARYAAAPDLREVVGRREDLVAGGAAVADSAGFGSGGCVGGHAAAALAAMTKSGWIRWRRRRWRGTGYGWAARGMFRMTVGLCTTTVSVLRQPRRMLYFCSTRGSFFRLPQNRTTKFEDRATIGPTILDQNDVKCRGFRQLM